MLASLYIHIIKNSIHSFFVPFFCYKSIFYSIQFAKSFYFYEHYKISFGKHLNSHL